MWRLYYIPRPLFSKDTASKQAQVMDILRVYTFGNSLYLYSCQWYVWDIGWEDLREAMQCNAVHTFLF